MASDAMQRIQVRTTEQQHEREKEAAEVECAKLEREKIEQEKEHDFGMGLVSGVRSGSRCGTGYLETNSKWRAISVPDATLVDD